jgi:tetratricopeptide (TPR) repeat protein
MSEVDLSFSRARALIERQEFDAAEREYASLVALEPTHPAAHFGLAKLRYMRGDRSFARDLAAAAAANRNHSALQMQFAEVLRLSGDLNGSELLLRDLIARQGPTPAPRSLLAMVLHEAGRLPEALVEASAAVKSRPNDSAKLETLVAVLLSLGRAKDAMPLIRAERHLAPLNQIWIAHEATAARLTGDPAYTVLYDYDRFVRVYDLDPPAGFGSIAEFNAALQARLTARHQLARQPFDQSMRSGTQTTGNLVADPDPAIQAALKAFLKPIADYRRRIGDAEDHPLAARNHGQTHYAGCWSVLLKAQGFHVNHIHPEGWLSSAYYISVPGETDDPEQQTGWIKFGEPRLPVPGAGPGRTVQPRPGRLVLFPSYMWHGTTALRGTAPRLTMAFDAVTRA